MQRTRATADVSKNVFHCCRRHVSFLTIRPTLHNILFSVPHFLLCFLQCHPIGRGILPLAFGVVSLAELQNRGPYRGRSRRQDHSMTSVSSFLSQYLPA